MPLQAVRGSIKLGAEMTGTPRNRPRDLSRREFIKLAALAGVLAGCRPAEPLGAPTGEPPIHVAPTLRPSAMPGVAQMPIPTSTLAPTGAPSVRPSAMSGIAPATTVVPATNVAPAPPAPLRPDIIKIYPTVKSKVIQTRCATVWQGENLERAALRKMLDASIAPLTGIDDADKAWAALFKPNARIAIKVNSVGNGSTHLALVLAVTERLQDLGIRPEQITLYDRASNELSDSGFPVNRSGSAVRCYGTDDQFTAGWTINENPVRLSRVLADCDALINMPILKALTIGGISFAMKNHYGSVDDPGRFHSNHFTPGITGLNALEPIRERTHLIIGDVLSEKTHADLTNYAVIGGTNSILMSFDPVAHDSVGLQMASEGLSASGRDPFVMEAFADEWLKVGPQLGLGTNEPANMDLVKVSLN